MHTYFSGLVSLILYQAMNEYKSEVQIPSSSFHECTLCSSRLLLPLQKASREHCIKWWSSWQEAVALGLVIALLEEGWAS